MDTKRIAAWCAGQSTVEFALVLPVLLLLTVAVCQVVLTVNCYMVAGSAAREGARTGAETNDADEAGEAAREAAAGLPGERPVVEVSFPEGRAKGSPVEVTVSYRMPLLLPWLQHVVPDVRFSRSAAMALEKGG